MSFNAWTTTRHCPCCGKQALMLQEGHFRIWECLMCGTSVYPNALAFVHEHSDHSNPLRVHTGECSKGECPECDPVYAVLKMIEKHRQKLEGLK